MTLLNLGIAGLVLATVALVYLVTAKLHAKRTAQPVPEPEPELREYHELSGAWAHNGCEGVDKCFVCVVTARLYAERMDPGHMIMMPYHDLIKWDDGSYSLMPHPAGLPRDQA